MLLPLLLAGVAACGGAEPQPKAPPPPPPARLAKKLDASLAALALPDELVLAGRWKNPSRLLAELEAWSGGRVALDRWLLTRLGEPSRPVDLTAPIELIVVLDTAGKGAAEPPALSWALTLGLGGAPGHSAPPAEPSDVESPVGLACAESRALGPAAARMVCAATDDELARLLPHATRALPLAPVGEADISISLRASPYAELDESHTRALASAWLDQLLEAVLGTTRVNDRFAAQCAHLVDDLAREVRDLARDLDGASIEFSLRANEREVELSVLAPAAAARSTLGQLMAGSGASGLAPAEFWQAQAASEGAGFSWAFQAAPIARWREPLAALLGTVFDYRGVPNRLEQQARELLLYLPMPKGPVIHASGRLPPVASSDARPRPAWLEALGWQLYSVRGNFAEYQYYVAALSRSFNDSILGPQFSRLIKRGLGPAWAPQSMQQRRPSTGRLPRGSFVLEATFAAPVDVVEPPVDAEARAAEAATGAARSRSRAPRPHELFAVFVPDEDGVRIAWGADERFLISLLEERPRPKASATLAARPGLGDLHQHRILAGGFVSLAGIEDLNAAPLGRALLDPGSAKSIDRAPHAGKSPIVYALSQPSEAWLHLTTRLGQDTVEDLLFLLGTSPEGG